MASGSLPHSISIHETSATNGGQGFAGINLGTVNYAGANATTSGLTAAVIKCRQDLFLTDPDHDREKVISAKGDRVAGTCEWITQDKSYRIWLDSGGDGDGDTRLLWISGGPGKGKTMMSVFLTQEIQRHTERIEGANLIFFFCSAEDERRNTAVAVLRGLVHEIILKRPQLVKHALPYFETPERTRETLSSLEALWIIFSKLVADVELGTMFCVIDGLDECTETTLRVLLPRIVRLLTVETPPSREGTFKLAIVSREMPGLQGCARVRLDPDNDEKVDSDIDLFVSVRVAELSRIEGFNEEFRESVHAELLRRAGGTFLWVGFAMYELSQKYTCSEIEEALKDLPIGLPAIYSRMLLRIPAKHREVSLAILRWVTMAARPLSLRELAAAVGIQASSPRLTVEQAARDAVTLCGPLLRVQEQTISLVHQSVRDYLVRKVVDNDAVLESFCLEAESAHLDLAQQCIAYIARSPLQQGLADIEDELHVQQSPLLRYAVHSWPEHAKRCPTLAAKLFDPSEFFLKGESSLRQYWWETYKPRYEARIIPLLHMACKVGIKQWIEAILAKSSWEHRPWRMNQRDHAGRTALHIAISSGHEAIVRLLLDRGADPEAKTADGRSALHIATAGREYEVVQLLLDKGVDVKARDNNGVTVLHSAAWRGNEAVVQLLVGLGADLEARDDYGETVLHLAARGENEVVVQLLVGLGADLKARDNNGNTVLHSAAWRGNKEVVQLLVGLGADPKARNNNRVTVLHSAAWGGNTEVVQLLVGLGADLKARNNDGQTALHSAARRGYTEVVRLLVGLGADLKARNNDGETALHLAAWEGNKVVVQLLVGLGTDIKAKNKNGDTALHLVASNWWVREDVVQSLLDAGADREAENNRGETALQVAAREGNSEVVQLLLERGAKEAIETEGVSE